MRKGGGIIIGRCEQLLAESWVSDPLSVVDLKLIFPLG
jgi:hypothetical protein